MAEYDESEYFTDTPEEIAERENQEALRRMMRTEIRRVQTGAADEDIARDIALEEEQRAKEIIAEEKRAKRTRMLSWVTGDVLLAEEAKRVYNLFTLLGVIFFASIVMIFWSLQQDIRCNKLQKEVSLLKERAIRTSEECFRYSSHSAVLRQLEERGIDIADPKSVPTIIK